MAQWITNSPEIAAKLKAIDAEWAKARVEAQGYALADKVQCYRAADRRRKAEYEFLQQENNK